MFWNSRAMVMILDLVEPDMAIVSRRMWLSQGYVYLELLWNFYEDISFLKASSCAAMERSFNTWILPIHSLLYITVATSFHLKCSRFTGVILIFKTSMKHFFMVKKFNFYFCPKTIYLMFLTFRHQRHGKIWHHSWNPNKSKRWYLYFTDGNVSWE